MTGPFSNIEVEPSKFLMSTLRILYLSFIINEVSNIISHGTPFFYSPHGYLFVGPTDYIALIGTSVLYIGLLNLNIELSADPVAGKRENKTPKLVILFFATVLVIDYLLEGIMPTIAQIVAAIAWFLLFTYVLLSSIMISRRPVENVLIKIRRRLLLWVVIPILLTGIIVLFAFSPRNSTGYNPIQHPEVEFYFLTIDFWAIAGSTFLTLIITLPKWFRTMIGISDKDYYLNLDYRFDLDWKGYDRIILQQLDTEEELMPDQRYILAYNTKDSLKIIEHLADEFPGDIIHITQINENILKSLTKTTHDLVYFDSGYSSYSQSQINFIRSKFWIYINYNGKNFTITRDGKEIKSEDYEYLFIGIYPPLINLRRKHWLVLYKQNMADAVVEFFKNYKSYFDELTMNKVFFGLVRFPIKDGVIQGIPSAFEGLKIPDQKYIITL